MRFHHLLAKHKRAPEILQAGNGLLQHEGPRLKAGTPADATLIAAPSSTKNASDERDPKLKQSTKGSQWYPGMHAHIGADADSGRV